MSNQQAVAKKPAVKKAVGKATAKTAKLSAEQLDMIRQAGNVRVETLDDEIVIRVRTDINIGTTGGGNISIASTGAPRRIILNDGRQVSVGLNVFQKVKPGNNQLFGG